MFSKNDNGALNISSRCKALSDISATFPFMNTIRQKEVEEELKNELKKVKGIDSKLLFYAIKEDGYLYVELEGKPLVSMRVFGGAVGWNKTSSMSVIVTLYYLLNHHGLSMQNALCEDCPLVSSRVCTRNIIKEASAYKRKEKLDEISVSV